MIGSLKRAISDEDHIKGNIKGPFKLVEYGDFQCPHCAVAEPVLEAFFENHSEEVCFVFRHCPLSSMHPDAEMAAVASEAAAVQGKFWEMHHALFENQNDLSLKNIVSIAKTLELDTNLFLKDIERADLMAKVKDDFASGIRSGVNGTPTLFINNVRFQGAPSYETLEETLEQVKGGSHISF